MKTNHHQALEGHAELVLSREASWPLFAVWDDILAALAGTVGADGVSFGGKGQ
jgi:hypothetical protein